MTSCIGVPRNWLQVLFPRMTLNHDDWPEGYFTLDTRSPVPSGSERTPTVSTRFGIGFQTKTCGRVLVRMGAIAWEDAKTNRRRHSWLNRPLDTRSWGSQREQTPQYPSTYSRSLLLILHFSHFCQFTLIHAIGKTPNFRDLMVHRLWLRFLGLGMLLIFLLVK